MAMMMTAAALAAGATAESVKIATPQAACEISCVGARVTSFKVRGEELLFAPREWKHGGGSFSSGGIPICWPWFGRSGPEGSKGHGFAHSLVFEVKSRTETSVALRAKSSADTKSIWPYDFDLECTIALDGDALSLRLETANTSSEPFLLTEGFHPYFLVGDRDKVVVKGVDGRFFCDARSSTAFDAAWKGDIAVTDAFDHVFASPDGEYSIVDASRGHTIKMSAQGNRRLVVWNPGDVRPADAVPAPGALGKDDWRHFVCVEPATLWRDQGFTLKPGERHSLSARISVAED